MDDGLHLSSSATSATVKISLSADAVGRISVPTCDTVTKKVAGNMTPVVGFMVLLDGMVTHRSRRPLTQPSVNEPTQVSTVNQSPPSIKYRLPIMQARSSFDQMT
jgi:hypothetical protein